MVDVIPRGRAACVRAALLLPGFLLAPFTAAAQDSAGVSRLPEVRLSAPSTIGSYVDERLRGRQLAESASTAGYLLRSLSSMNPALPGDVRRPRVGVVLPQLSGGYNTSFPITQNDGALWAGRGGFLTATGGLRASWGRVHLLALPELTWSDNRLYPQPDTVHFYPVHTRENPRFWQRRADLSEFASPFHPVQSIDLPIQFGDRPITLGGWGQSTLMWDAGAVAAGASTENEWWGPGVRNALVLSNHAGGFPHLFARTGTPLTTPAGTFEARVLHGVLQESPYFDFEEHNDLRAISMGAITWQPVWTPGVTLGFARAVYSATSGWFDAVDDFPQLFLPVGRPNNARLESVSSHRARDQINSLFFRWILPADGFEAYGEWGRYEWPISLRALLLEPNETQAYTLGLGWLGDPWYGGGRLQVRSEVAYLQQDASFRHRTLGSWYTSRVVDQGYTHKGQVLGAAIGPGSSSQWIALDYVAPAWFGGVEVDRVRWMEDVHAQAKWFPTKGWCEHDVSLLGGVRGGWQTRLATVTAKYVFGLRRNIFYESDSGGCAQDIGRNHRTNQLSLTITPSF